MNEKYSEQSYDSGVKQQLQTLKSSTAKLLPRKAKVFLKNAYLDCIDLLEKDKKKNLFGEQAWLVPPLRLMHDGPQNLGIYKQTGDEYFDIFVRLCGLRPTDQILDVGCGIGRKTLPLLAYVNPNLGQYEGIDVDESHIEWCKKKIEKAYPHFQFQHVDIWSGLYNPSGKIRAKEYRFPFQNESFDFVILGSVFTHMFATDMRQYVGQINRVLKPGGRGMISYFLLNAESETFIEEGKSTQQLVYEAEPGCKADNPDRLESAVGHNEKDVIELYASYGIKSTVYYGSWCGRSEHLTYQDVICIEK